MGAAHADDIEFVFGAPLGSTKNYTEGEKHLSSSMMNYFTSFAKSGYGTQLSYCDYTMTGEHITQETIARRT